MNCVNWYESFAFCIWDGGRLPTESGWEYASAGGSQERQYPWGNVPVADNTPGTADFAAYGCMADGSMYGVCSPADIPPAGSRPAGKGRYGQRDLAGSMLEWALDTWGEYPSTAVGDHAQLNAAANRVIRGGYFSSEAWGLRATNRNSTSASSRSGVVGVRCARDP
jgi:formylglycine-generating enzyme required for sulfatase activity